MARKASIPKYRRQRRKGGTDRSFAEIDGVRRYLGAFNSPESGERYARLLVEWQSSPGRLHIDPDVTIVEFLAAYWQHVETYYVKDGRPTSEVESTRCALRPLQRLYGRTSAAEFSPRKIKAVRQAMISQGLCRNSVNRHIQRIKQAFKWAVAEEMVPATVYHGLQAVVGLRKGRVTLASRLRSGRFPANSSTPSSHS